MHVLYPSPPRLAVSVIVVTMLLIALAHSLQLLAYVYFAVVTILYLSEVLASYHILYHKVIS